MLTHYWGPSLLDRWAWVSATGFLDAPELRLEAFVARSTAWGRTPAWFPAGYLWIGDAKSGELTVSPITGFVRSGLDRNRLTLGSLRVDGHRHRVEAWAPSTAFVDLGEGIKTTLLGDAVLDGRSALARTVDLEFRNLGRRHVTCPV